MVEGAKKQVPTARRHSEENIVSMVSSAECERHFSAFNARHIITAQRNSMLPETVQALSIVLEGYKNGLIK